MLLINIDLLFGQTQHLNNVVHLFTFLQHVSAILFGHHLAIQDVQEAWIAIHEDSMLTQ
jgi:hypothetical protein